LNFRNNSNQKAIVCFEKLETPRKAVAFADGVYGITKLLRESPA